MKRAQYVLAAIACSVVLVVSGCTGVDGASVDGGSNNPDVADSDATGTDSNDAAFAFDASATGPEPYAVVPGLDEASEHLGAEIVAPGAMDGARLTTVSVSTPEAEESSPVAVKLEYSDSTRVYIQRVGQEDAQDWWDSTASDVDLAAWADIRQDGNRRMISVDRMDIPLKLDASGEKIPGTGIEVGSSRVDWVQGDFLIFVRNADVPSSALEGYARAIDVR